MLNILCSVYALDHFDGDMSGVYHSQCRDQPRKRWRYCNGSPPLQKNHLREAREHGVGKRGGGGNWAFINIMMCSLSDLQRAVRYIDRERRR